MSRYCTALDVRTFTGLSITDASDLDLEDFLDPATKGVVEQITVTKNWEILSTSSDAPTDFYTEKYPLADVDGDATVGYFDNGDFTIADEELLVYLWEDVADASTKTKATIANVYASEGRIVLDVAPGPDIEAVTANYHYYPNEIDSTLLKRTTALNAGYLYTFTKWVWIPDTYQIGPIRMRNIVPVWEKIYKEYVRSLALLQKRQYAIREPWDKKSLSDMDKVWR